MKSEDTFIQLSIKFDDTPIIISETIKRPVTTVKNIFIKKSEIAAFYEKRKSHEEPVFTNSYHHVVECVEKTFYCILSGNSNEIEISEESYNTLSIIFLKDN